MTATCTQPNTRLNDLLSICFEGGERRCRELRLSPEDAQYIGEHYHATVRPMGEHWYEISFMGVI